MGKKLKTRTAVRRELGSIVLVNASVAQVFTDLLIEEDMPKNV